MSQIVIKNLTFGYEDGLENVFEDVSIAIDTSWKLGLLGRNGKGKTTLAKLLMGQFEYSGHISMSNVHIDYFPFELNTSAFQCMTYDLISEWSPNCEEWKVICELSKMNTDENILFRPFCTLSNGEQVKVMLAVLFSVQNNFIIIDEPTNHLDSNTREIVKRYLKSKKGFIIISHDRDFLDETIDHVLILNRKTIELQSGNFSSWWENKRRQDIFNESEHRKHLREIEALENAITATSKWASKSEGSKIGFNPSKEHDRYKDTRAYIGSKTKKMQSRVKNYEVRINREISQKKDLLQDIEKRADLKINPQNYFKETLIYCKDFSLKFCNSDDYIINNLDFQLKRGERVFLNGKNGCGKSSFIKEVIKASDLYNCNQESFPQTVTSGNLSVGKGILISYIPQDVARLSGSFDEYCEKKQLEKSLMLGILQQLDVPFGKSLMPLEKLSDGQKKKILIAQSLLQPAHLFIWDEPMNYIDIFSRMQLEDLILKYKPTMLIVDHDSRFKDNVATRVVDFM